MLQSSSRLECSVETSAGFFSELKSEADNLPLQAPRPSMCLSIKQRNAVTMVMVTMEMAAKKF